MKQKKIVALFLISLFLFSMVAIAGLTSATTTVTVTLQTQSGGSAYWTSTSGPIPSQGGLGTFYFQSGVEIDFHATPNSGYHFDGFYLYYVSNGQNFAQSFNLNTAITFPSGMPAIRIQAHYSVQTIAQYHMTCNQDPNEYVNPGGVTLVNAGQSLTYYYSANTGYQINSVVVDGANVAIVGYYTFSNIQSDHSITIHSGLIPTSNYLINFVNETGGSIAWTDFGIFEGTPPTNPTMGGDGTFGFPAGENLQIQASPDAVNGYVFANMTISGGSLDGTVITNTVYSLTVQDAFTITAYFNHVPTTNYTGSFTSSGGGQLTWIDNTTMINGSNGTFSFNVGDTITVNANPYAGYYFKGLFGNEFLGGLSMNQQEIFVAIKDFNISALFTNSSLNYTVSMQFNPAPLNLNLDSTTINFILVQGQTYTVTVYLTDLGNDAIFGIYNVSITQPNANPAIVKDVGTPLYIAYGIDPTNPLNNPATNNQWSTVFNAVQTVYAPGGSYTYAATNNNFGSGNFPLQFGGVTGYSYTVYQGIEISVLDELNHINFNTPIYTLSWLTPAQAAGQPTPTPITTSSPSIPSTLIGWFWGQTVRELYSVIIISALSFLFLWKGGVWGLFFGIAIGEIISILFLGFPSWTLYPLIGVEIVIVATAVLGERGSSGGSR